MRYWNLTDKQKIYCRNKIRISTGVDWRKIMDLTNYILPYPYEAYTKFERRDSFDKYKEKIYGWVKKNTWNIDILKNIDDMFSLVQNSGKNNAVKKWIVEHIEKCRYIGDFSGLEFGIQIDEESESVNLRFPCYIDDIDKVLYPRYDEMLFKDLSIIAKLEWMYKNCEFIPFRVIHEDISLSDDRSYKFSHIKRDNWIMQMLDSYLNGLKYQPSDNIYYFIEFNAKTRVWYLKRDLKKSPKRQ